MTTLKLSYFMHIRRREGSLEKTVMLGKIESTQRENRGPKMRQVDPIKKAIGMCLQELSRAVEDRTLWTSLIHRVTRNQSQLNVR